MLPKTGLTYDYLNIFCVHIIQKYQGMHDTPQLAAGEALARYKAEQESKGRVLSFAEAAEEYGRIKV